MGWKEIKVFIRACPGLFSFLYDNGTAMIRWGKFRDEASKTEKIRGREFLGKYFSGKVFEIVCGNNLVIPNSVVEFQTVLRKVGDKIDLSWKEVSTVLLSRSIQDDLIKKCLSIFHNIGE